jgi:succinate dehydrogenase/fumarate reductase flavoprotein subunit
MLGAFVYGRFAGESAARYCAEQELPAVDAGQVEAERSRVWGPLQRSHGLPPNQVEYKLRRMVNDYLQPPKVTKKMEIGLERFEGIRHDLEHLHARNPHELMRALEVHFIRDCAEMAARASLYRTESRWGLYHARVDYPERDDANWNVHVQVHKNEQGEMACFKRALEPYLIAPNQDNAYHQLRIAKAASNDKQAVPA